MPPKYIPHEIKTMSVVKITGDIGVFVFMNLIIPIDNERPHKIHFKVICLIYVYMYIVDGRQLQGRKCWPL